MIIALHCQTSLHSPLETYFLSTADIQLLMELSFQKRPLLSTMMNVLDVVLTAGERQVSGC